MKEEKVCKSVDYINKIAKNLKEIKKGELERLLQALRNCRRIVLGGEGRSRSGLLIGIRGINKRTFSETDSSWHWRNITEAALDFEQKLGKTLLLINSGRGTTATPKEMAKDLRAFINKTNSQKFIICAVTSNTKSEIAQQCDVVVELRGREEGKEKEDASTFDSGTMGDIYELASMVLFRIIKEAINNDLSAEDMLVAMEKEMKIIGELIDKYLASKHYQDLVEETASRGITVIGGRGPDREVAEMTVIRIFHINRLVGREAYVTGPLAPPPKPGDILILISFSGETKSTLEWGNIYKAAGAIVFSIVGTADSTLSKESKSYILETPIEEFYARVAFLLSPLPGGVMEKFRECGTHIPEEIIRILGHTKTE